MNADGAVARPTHPALVYLVTDDWYFLSHRLPMACAARDAGFRVHVATRVSGRAVDIVAHGFELHPLDWCRGSLNPRDVFDIVRQVRALYRRLRPAIVHHVALQPSVIGSLAALGLPPVRLNALAGLGYGFTSRSVKARLVNVVLSALLRFLFSRPRTAVLVQNPDDREALRRLGVADDVLSTIAGSGVDTENLVPLPEREGPPTAAFVGRLLDDKGIRTLMAAHAIARQHAGDLCLLVAGSADAANPSSIPDEEIEDWRRRPGVELLGHVEDIREVWKRAHVAVLPSRREGLPKSLLEAAACGRPLIATDVPGCREIAQADVNAILVPPDDADALAQALLALARDAGLRRRFGAAARQMVEARFAADRIGKETVALYQRLLASDGP